jgi:hypothetical protein
MTERTLTYGPLCIRRRHPRPRYAILQTRVEHIEAHRASPPGPDGAPGPRLATRRRGATWRGRGLYPAKRPTETALCIVATDEHRCAASRPVPPADGRMRPMVSARSTHPVSTTALTTGGPASSPGRPPATLIGHHEAARPERHHHYRAVVKIFSGAKQISSPCSGSPREPLISEDAPTACPGIVSYHRYRSGIPAWHRLAARWRAPALPSAVRTWRQFWSDDCDTFITAHVPKSSGAPATNKTLLRHGPHPTRRRSPEMEYDG